MDNRSEPRFAVDECVTVTTLGGHSFRQNAWIKNVSATGLGVVVQKEIDPGTVVRIERDDALLLGEAMFCRRVEDGHFVGVQLEQILRGLNELHQRIREFEEGDLYRGAAEGAEEALRKTEN